MIIIAVFPTYKGYEDSIKMIIELCNKAEKVYLITKHPLPKSICQQKNFKLCHFSGKKRGITFILAALKIFYHIICKTPIEKEIILHDYFVPWIGPFVKVFFHKRSKNIHTVLSLYAANPSLMSMKGWRNKKAKRKDIKRELFYRKMLYGRIFIERLFTPFYDLITGNSEEVTDGIKSGKIVKVWDSELDINKFTPMDIKKEEIGYKNSDKIILYVGRILLWRKGIDVLFKAFCEAKKKTPDIKLLLIGSIDPYDKKEFEEARESLCLKELVKVIPGIPSNELMRYYSAADLFVHPSINEGSPRALKEALACGIPAIASNIPGHKRVDAGSGMIPLFNVGDWQTLSILIVNTFLGKSFSRSSNDFRKHIVDHFSCKAVASQLITLYQGLLQLKK